MKKYLKVLAVFMILGLVTTIIIIVIHYSNKISSVTTQEENDSTVNLDIESFKRYQKSHFGFMHPRTSFSFASKLNVHWQRNPTMPFVWNNVEISKGEYDWEEYDYFIKESCDYDTLIVATIWPYADWDQETCRTKLSESQRDKFQELGDYRSKPCDFNSYSNFLKNLVERYDGDGVSDMPELKYPIKYWEIMNEPEIEGVFFKGDHKSSDYLEILKLSYQTIKASDSTAFVLSGGMTSLDGQNLLFWEEIQEKGGFEYTDLFSIHAIGGPEDLHLNVLSNFLDKNNLQGDIWITEIEFGISDETFEEDTFEPEPIYDVVMEEIPIEPAPLDDLSEEEWAIHLVKVYVQAFKQGADKLFYVGLDNTSPGEETAFLVNCEAADFEDFDDFEDVYDSDLCIKQKPFFAFQTLVEKIDYFDRVEKISEGQYRFIINQNTVYVLWGNGSIPSELKGNVNVVDIYGQSEIMNAETIELAESPIYIELSE